MEIRKATIYGFGKWVHFDLDFSKGMCVYGENESGKSTIHQFILFMLFGLPPKQRTFFQPKEGAQVGGRLTMFDEEIGEFTIERLDQVKNGAATCYTPDGKEYDEVWLREQLKGTTIATYESIFSFSAMDLTGIANMKEVDLSEMILGIGLTGSTEIYQLEKHLESHLSKLFKPSGTKPKINEQLAQLEKRYTTLVEFKENEATYREKKWKQLELEEERVDLHTEWKREKQNLTNLEKYLQAYPFLLDYQQAEEQLQSYEENVRFPESGINRLENLKQTLLPLQSELRILQENEKKYKANRINLQNQLVDSSLYHAVEQLNSEKETYVSVEKELERIENVIHKKEIEIEAELDRLNIDIGIEEIVDTPFPFHLEKTWTQIKRDVEQLTQDKEKLQREQNDLKQERNDIYRELEEVEKYVLSDEEYLKLNDRLQKTREVEVLQRMQEEADRKQKTWNKRKKKKEKNIQFIFLGSLALAIILALVGFVMTIDWLPLIGFIVLLVGLGQWVIGKRSLKEWDDIQSTSLSMIESSYSKEEMQEAELKLLQHNKYVNIMDTLKERLEQNDRKRTSMRENMKRLEEKEHRLNTEINKQVREYPYLQFVDIAFWPEFYHNLKQLRSNAKDYLQVIEERERLQTRLEQIRQKLVDFYQMHQWEIPESVPQQWKVLHDFLVQQQDRKQEIKQYENFLVGNKEEQQEVVQRIETYEKEMEALYKLANVATEEEFYQKAREVAERKQWEESLEKSVNQLERIFPNQSWRVYLTRIEPEKDIEGRLNETVEKVKDLEEEMMEIERDLAKLMTQLDTMESETNYSDHLHQYELEQGKFTEQAKKWAIFKVAKDLLTQTKRAYQEKHLQQVIDQTTNYFERLTGSKYRKIYTPSKTKEFQVETAEGIRFSVNELSKGTMDQLYVSLRLAIGQVLSENNRLPFIVDDAFLHFDSIRTNRIIHILEEISQSRQVILFTCKEEIAEANRKFERIDLVNSVRVN